MMSFLTVCFLSLLISYNVANRFWEENNPIESELVYIKCLHILETVTQIVELVWHTSWVGVGKEGGRQRGKDSFA